MKSLCFAAFLLIAGCNRHQQPVVRIVSFTTLEAFPFRFAQDLGHFRDEGLRVELEEATSGTKAGQAVIGGSADVVAAGLGLTVTAAATGGQLRTFYTLSDGDGTVLLVSGRNADRLKSVADLKGAIIGVSALGSWTDRVLAFYLSRAGLSYTDARVTAVGLGSTGVAAVVHNKVDAFVTPALELASLKVRAPGARVLVDPRPREQLRAMHGVEAFPSILGLSATPRWLAENPDQARRLTRAMNRTVRWIKEQPPEQILARLALQLRDEERPVYLEQLKIAIGMLSKDGRMPPGGPEAVQRVLAASMDSVKSVHLASTWTDEFLEEQK